MSLSHQQQHHQKTEAFEETTSQFDRRVVDVGLILAGGAQKLPGPHQTLCKGIPSFKVPFLQESHISKQYLRIFIRSHYIIDFRPRC